MTATEPHGICHTCRHVLPQRYLEAHGGVLRCAWDVPCFERWRRGLGRRV